MVENEGQLLPGLQTEKEMAIFAVDLFNLAKRKVPVVPPEK